MKISEILFLSDLQRLKIIILSAYEDILCSANKNTNYSNAFKKKKKNAFG